MEFLELLEGLRNPVFDFFFALITHLGEETFFLVIALCVYWCVDKKCGFYVLLVGFFGTVFNQFLKLIFRIPRPWILNPDFTIVENARAAATGYSFPSGHTQCIAGTFGSIGLFYRNKKSVWIPSLVIVALVAFSRLYLGVHTPLDVGVSLFIAAALVFAVYPLIKLWDSKPFYIYVLSLIMICLAALLLVFAVSYDFPADADAANIASGVKSGYTLLGAALALPLMLFLDSKYIKYSVKATLPIQILKAVSGLAVVLLVKEGLKLPFDALFSEGNGIARAIRYFIVVLTAGVLCPMLFKLYAKIGKKREAAETKNK